VALSTRMGSTVSIWQPRLAALHILSLNCLGMQIMR